jgi:hypothetical protein
MDWHGCDVRFVPKADKVRRTKKGHAIASGEA